MDGTPRARRTRTTPTTRLLLLRTDREYENHGVAVVGWDDAYPAARASAPTPRSRRATARSSCATAGAATGATTATSGCPTTTSRSPATSATGRLRRRTSYSVVADVGDYSRNYGWDKLGVTDRMGYPDGSPIWAANRFTAASIRPHHGGELLHAVVGHAVRSLGGPRASRPSRGEQRAPRAPGLRHRQARHAARGGQGQAVRGGDQADVAGRSDAARHRATGRLRPTRRPAGLRPGERPRGPELRRPRALAPARPDEPRSTSANVCLKAFAR